MITLSLTVPSADAILAAGFNQIIVLRSANQTPTGVFAAVGNPVAVQSGVSSYTFIDAAGGWGDWYETQYAASGGGTPSKASGPQPGYLSDLCGAARDLIGVTIANVTDAQIQGFGLLPSALARVRTRLATFDALIASGGDPASLCLSALAHLVAALLCPRMTSAVFDMEIFKDYRYQRNRSLDWTATAATLMDEYETLISQAAGESVYNSLIDTAILMGGPTAGARDVSGGLVPFYPEGGNRTGSLYAPDTGD